VPLYALVACNLETAPFLGAALQGLLDLRAGVVRACPGHPTQRGRCRRLRIGLCSWRKRVRRRQRIARRQQWREHLMSDNSAGENYMLQEGHPIVDGQKTGFA